MTPYDLKTDLLSKYHTAIGPIAKRIASTSRAHQQKAKAINQAIGKYKSQLLTELPIFSSDLEKQQAHIILQYCTSVVSLEFRHSVWPYEYMALSRRVGELWERFCRAAWDVPSRPEVQRFQAPAFSEVVETLRQKIGSRLDECHAQSEIIRVVDTLFELIGEINMMEDEMLLVNGRPHIIDFKSGFGSNEKSNTMRLLTVGKAYKQWNPDTVLLFLVRQEKNNNYLNVIKCSGLWDVHCGAAAYDKIDELSGSDIKSIRDSVVDFEKDLSSKFWSDLSSQLSDLTSYLAW